MRGAEKPNLREHVSSDRVGGAVGAEVRRVNHPVRRHADLAQNEGAAADSIHRFGVGLGERSIAAFAQGKDAQPGAAPTLLTMSGDPSSLGAMLGKVSGLQVLADVVGQYKAMTGRTEINAKTLRVVTELRR